MINKGDGEVEPLQGLNISLFVLTTLITTVCSQLGGHIWISIVSNARLSLLVMQSNMFYLFQSVEPHQLKSQTTFRLSLFQAFGRHEILLMPKK